MYIQPQQTTKVYAQQQTSSSKQVRLEDLQKIAVQVIENARNNGTLNSTQSSAVNLSDGKNVATQENQYISRTEFSHHQYGNNHSRAKLFMSRLWPVIKKVPTFVVNFLTNILAAWIYDKVKKRR